MPARVSKPRKRTIKVARLHARVADARRDFLHKISTRLVRENDVISVEDLNVRGMIRNRRLARAISCSGWAEFRSMLEYKAGGTAGPSSLWTAGIPARKPARRVGTCLPTSA